MQIKVLPSLTSKISEFRSLSKNTFPEIPSAGSFIDITNPQKLGFYLDKAILEFFNLSLMMSVNNIPLGKRMFMAACIPIIIKGKLIPAIDKAKFALTNNRSEFEINKEILSSLMAKPEIQSIISELKERRLLLFDKNA